jgi:hypothetical protein
MEVMIDDAVLFRIWRDNTQYLYGPTVSVSVRSGQGEPVSALLIK